MRPTHGEAAELAADREKRAAHCERTAQSFREDAADPTLPDDDREQSARAAVYAEQHARTNRAEAAALREGRLTGEDL